MTSMPKAVVREVEASVTGPLSSLVGQSAPMRQMFGLMGQVASTSLAVLITGETGTGKELVARAVHAMSDRSRRPFVAINGSEIPGTLLESELFGHSRGAFTGAVASRRGLVEAAHGGTLFIDEVSTLDPSVQVKLLRTIEDRHIRPLGSTQMVAVDFRLIAATNEDLVAKVQRGEFREDLYYRLNVFPIVVPPLRDRRDDIPALAEHFRRAFARASGVVPPPFADTFLDRIHDLPWSGNVRELEHFVQRAIVLRLQSEDVRCVAPLSCVPEPPLQLKRAAVDGWSLARLESAYIHDVLESVQGNRSRAAAILGIDRRTLHRKLSVANNEPDGAGACCG